MQRPQSLFDDLVGPGEKRSGNFDTKILGRFEVDAQFELCWLLDGKVGGPGTLEYFVDVGGAQAV